MRICLLGLEMTPLNGKDIFIGGTVNNVIRLSKGLTTHKHEVHIVTSDINRNFREDIQTPWAVIHPISVHGPYGSVVYAMEVATKLWYKTLRIHSQKRFDIINVHTGYTAMSAPACMISMSVHVPVALTLYSTAEGFGSFGDLYKRILTPIERGFFLPKMGKIIAISKNVRKSLENKNFQSERITYIPPAVDLEQFNPHTSKRKAKEELGMDEESSLILYIGSWNPDKGVNTLVDAMKNILTDFCDTKFVLALAGVEQDNLEKERIRNTIRHLDLESRVIELGPVRDVGKLMAASDIIVVPYLNTNGIADQPLTVIEAMACGRPVVATNVGGVGEIIKNGVNGILVSPGQSLEIEEALRFLLENRRESETIGANAACCISKSHSIYHVVPLLERVYEELVRS